jgi:hypothetical protein
MSDFQPTFDFSGKLPPEVQEKIAAGMQQADENADSRWKYMWDACVVAAAKRLAELTSDDVLEEYEKLKYQPGTHNLSAIGPAMKRAMKMGALSPTDRTARSKRIEKNGNLHVIWKSNLFGAKS